MAFDLSTISKQAHQYPPRVTMYGEEGIGKTTFGASAPSPFFLLTEDGADAFEVAKTNIVDSYQTVTEVIDALLAEKHDYQTFVIDSIDWLEPLVWMEVCKQHEKAAIEDFGYGKGYVYAADKWRELLAHVNRLRLEKGMAVILIAHAQVKRFDDPTTDPYDRYKIKLHDKSAAVVQEWSDIIGFASQRVITRKEDVGFNNKVSRGIATGERMLHLHGQPAFVAKNRYHLPESIPLSWDALVEAITNNNS